MITTDSEARVEPSTHIARRKSLSVVLQGRHDPHEESVRLYPYRSSPIQLLSPETRRYLSKAVVSHVTELSTVGRSKLSSGSKAASETTARYSGEVGDACRA